MSSTLSITERERILKMARAASLQRGAPKSAPIVPVERGGRLALSFAQQRLWFLEQMGELGSTYHIPMRLRLRGALDRAALARTLERIVARHESLRTVFVQVDGEPEQRILPVEESGFGLVEHDLRGEPDAEAELECLVAREADAPFDLERGPLVRAHLVRQADDDHLLLLTMHHVVSDAWSTGVFVRELITLYTAFSQGEPDPLPPLPVQYADYAAWQRQWVKGEVLDAQAAYWSQMLAGAPELLELPTDHARPARQDHAGATLPVELGRELAAGLTALSHRHGTTLYMTVLAGWATVLARLSGQDDVVVGTPSANRTRPEVEELIGFFVNTLALRMDLSGAPTVAELLGRVKARALEAQRNQDLPFEQVVERVQPARSLAYSPLFQVMFVWQDAARGAPELPGLQLAPAAGAPQVTAKFDLLLTLGEAGGQLAGRVEYATSLFERATVERWMGYLRTVLEGMAADDGRSMDRLPMLDETERRLVLREWNATGAAYPRDACIHAPFEAQAARTPEAVAVLFEESSLTYAELNARANRLAHHLVRLGVGPEVRVGVLMERSLEMVVSLLAILKAGGAYVPLAPELPAERLAYMLDDSGVPLVLVQAALRGTVPVRDGVEVLVVDTLTERLAPEPAENPAGGTGPDSLAYVIYTSGSTGRPKGVMNQHGGVVNRLAWMQAQFGIGADDVVLQKTPFGFDVSVWELFWPLQQGARLVMARPDGHRDPQYLQEVIERRGVTTLHFVPSLLQPFVETVDAGRCASLRHVVCSGEALSPALVRRFHDRFAGPVELTNLYGPTEAAVDVSCWTCPREGSDGVVPIGRPVWNTALYVLDAGLRPVPVGVAGELYIGGVQVARGYQGRAAMTAERFVPDPFSEQGGARLYRTGDRARWRADGAIEYLGRLDFQVKLRGFRIELGEIEAVLRRSEGVADCVVVARGESGEQRLVAYVVGEAEAEALRAHLRQSLPEYMVPAAFVVLDRLPLSANGKLDRRALPAPEGDAFATRAYEAPLGEAEEVLAGIWAELLGVERVGRWDHFFELGGHSLLAIKLVGRMRRAGLHADVRALFTTPVLAELALAAGGASSEVKVPANRIPTGCEVLTPEMLPLAELSQPEIDRIVAEVPGGAANVQDIYALAPLQEGILFHHLMSDEGDPYLLSSMTEFDTRARLEEYLAALQTVIDRHDVLRTSVTWEGLSEPVQVVWRHARLPVEEVELDADTEDAAEQLWRRFDPRRYRMELGRAPLLRACVAEDRARGRWLLLKLTHHLAGDHESLEVQREEIRAHLMGRGSELPAPLPFRDYVAQARLGVSRAEHERFFRGMLTDVEEPTAPYGLLDVWGEGHGIGEAWLRVESDLGARLRRRARALGVSTASLCHLAWAQVLARLSGRDDVVFGTVLFGRMQGGEGADRVMGPLINTLPVRIGVGAEGAEAAVRRTHALLADLLRHEHASLELAQHSSGVAAPAPLFTSLLNYRYSGARGGSQEAGQAEEGVRSIIGQERTNYPVTLAVDDWGEAFSLNAQVAAPAEAERVCRMMHTALERLVEALEVAPGRAIGSLDVLPEAERRIVVEAWNRTEADYSADACIHELFEAQAARTPEAVAVVFEQASLTYAELNARANRLAHHLRGRGVGPEVRVGVLVERSTALVTAVLGVLKAGGAYVPLDPTYPAERLRYVLEDSGARVLVSGGGAEAALGGEGVDGIAVVELDAEADAIAREPETPPRSGAGPQNLAYVIHTSGSTGRPKGTGVPHRSVASSTRARSAWYGADPERFLLLSSIAFDSSVAGVFWTLCGGGALHLMRSDAQREPAEVVRQMGERGITDLLAVPSYYAALLRFVSEPLPSLARAIVAGEAAPRELAERHGALLPHAELVNEYGPTEATVWSTAYRCPPDTAGAGVIPIGGPIPNARAYVVDGRGRPVPIGVAGELWVGGAGVTRGYLGRSALTAERFVPDPFSGEAGARLYRTGDRARWRADGALEFLGRLDHQVKVRGFRIEPGEVEAALRGDERVADCAVVAREEVPGEARLVAYVVGNVGADALRERLRRSLPEYMVPAAFVFLEALPLTPNGKLDRRALPAPELASGADRYAAPLGETEAALAEIWAELLGAERIGRGDDFFALGGHSLLAIRVISRVRQTLGVEAAVRDLFVRPVLADFARGLETAERAEETAIAPVDRSGPLALSFAQQRLWFIEQMEGVGAAYHLPMRLRLRGELDRGALVRALNRIVARHEALRTTFPTVEGEPVQRIAPVENGDFPVVEHDLRASAGAEDELRRLVQEEAGAPFDLAQGPLLRGRLVRMAADDNVLLLNMHHIVSDGWSMGIFTRELSALYAAFTRGEPDPLPPLQVQYADYAAWQRRWAEGPVLEAQAEYWTATLAGAPELLALPTDHPRPAKQDFTGASVRVELDEALTAALKALSQRHGTTLFMTLLCGWAAVLARLSGQDDVVVGTASANRGRAEIEDLIGFFVNTLPLRVDLSGAPTVAGLLERVRALALEAQRNQDIPFEQVVERVHPARSLAHAPLFQAMFVWQNAPEGRLELPGLAFGPLHPAGSEGSPSPVAAKFDLSLTLWEHGGRIVGEVTYATALFDRATVERWLGYLRRVLDGMVAADTQPVHRLELLSAAERRTVVEEWNATDVAFPAGACAHELFEEQAARTPEAVALSFDGEALTYAELNARANRLAHHLRALGVGPEKPVAVCMRRGMETVVTLLAALKAGGGYLPLDPGHPEERFRYTLDDSAPAALMTWGALAARFAAAGAPVVDLGDPAAWDAYPASNPDRGEVGVGPENLAYIVYTSGSTGRPKGVPVRHDSLVNLLAVTRAAFGVGPGDVLPALAPAAFDISLFELLLPLVSGAELRLVPPPKVMDPRVLLGEIEDATLLSAVPALMRDIVQVERRAPRLTRVRGAFVGGEQVPADLLAEMGAVFPAAQTYVVYGPTEATVLASAHAVPADVAVAGYPIGRPLGNVHLHVCDAFGDPQPVGVAGELRIGGVGVARGYVGRPALTAERFVPDPFSARPGARLYRSGDRARWKEGGVLDFLGRTDFQVKIRGIRIEPGEIEARLREHPAVREAVVLAREDAPGKKRLVAYVVGDATAEALTAHLAARLPGYMVPWAYVRLEAFPLTRNGKVDRGALPVPDGASYARRRPEPPRTMGEQVLADIWAEVLGVQRVSRRDHFFDLGGHSMLAVRMVGRVRETLNPAATVDDVFAYPTLYELAARLQGSGEWFGTTHAIPVRETGSERPLFVAHDAVGIVFYGQLLRPHLDAEIPIYALPGPLNDADDLTSLDDLVTRLVRMITEVQPEGPYRVAGWSAGGVFAYAVAERLVSTGKAVEFVGLLDAFHPALAKQDSPRERQFTVLELLARDCGVSPATPEALQVLREDTEGLELPAFIATCKARGLLPETLAVSRAEQVYDRIALLKRSHAEYVPGPLPVSAHIFSSDESVDHPRRGWEDMPGGAPFLLERVPGTHHTIWKKGNVEVVGAAISRAIRASAAGGG